MRSENNFVGLTNLGATCYVNCILQLWFHNSSFRKAIYSWVPWFDPLEKQKNADEFLLKDVPYNPKSPVGKLQILFALMEFSKRRFIIKIFVIYFNS